eukprot:g1921.t1
MTDRDLVGDLQSEICAYAGAFTAGIGKTPHFAKTLLIPDGKSNKETQHANLRKAIVELGTTILKRKATIDSLSREVEKDLESLDEHAEQGRRKRKKRKSTDASASSKNESNEDKGTTTESTMAIKKDANDATSKDAEDATNKDAGDLVALYTEYLDLGKTLYQLHTEMTDMLNNVHQTKQDVLSELLGNKRQKTK